LASAAGAQDSKQQGGAAPEKGSASPEHRTTGSATKSSAEGSNRASATAARQATTHTARDKGQRNATERHMTERNTAERNTNVRSSSRTTVSSNGHWVSRGGHRVWVSFGSSGGSTYGATGVAYGVSSGGAGHSCWWYRHYDPADAPRWCPGYGTSYGYTYRTYRSSSPSYSYGYHYRAGETRAVSSDRETTHFSGSARVSSRTHAMTTTQGSSRTHAMSTTQGGARTGEKGEHGQGERMQSHAQSGGHAAPSGTGAKDQKQTQ